MEYLKKTGKFLGNLLVGAWAILVYIGFSIVMLGLLLRLIHYALAGYSLWI
jgi:uncharacterized membrane protein